MLMHTHACGVLHSVVPHTVADPTSLAGPFRPPLLLSEISITQTLRGHRAGCIRQGARQPHSPPSLRGGGDRRPLDAGCLRRPLARAGAVRHRARPLRGATALFETTLYGVYPNFNPNRNPIPDHFEAADPCEQHGLRRHMRLLFIGFPHVPTLCCGRSVISQSWSKMLIAMTSMAPSSGSLGRVGRQLLMRQLVVVHLKLSNLRLGLFMYAQ